MNVIRIKFKIFVYLFLLTAGIFPLFVTQAVAYNDNTSGRTVPDTSYEEVFVPVMSTNSVIIDDDNEEAQEPNIGEIKYQKYPTLRSVDERVDRLIHGITTYIRPEYDYYGHGIRRYMAHVGNMKIYKDQDFLLEQYRNAKKAAVIVDYWKKYLENEISEIEKIMKEDNSVPLTVRTTFRQNKTIVRAFIVSLKAWVDSNEQLLQKIGEYPEIYQVLYPEIIITNGKYRVEYFNLMSMRAAKLKDIRNYSPFALMVY